MISESKLKLSPGRLYISFLLESAAQKQEFHLFVSLSASSKDLPFRKQTHFDIFENSVSLLYL